MRLRIQCVRAFVCLTFLCALLTIAAGAQNYTSRATDSYIEEGSIVRDGTGADPPVLQRALFIDGCDSEDHNVDNNSPSSTRTPSPSNLDPQENGLIPCETESAREVEWPLTVVSFVSDSEDTDDGSSGLSAAAIAAWRPVSLNAGLVSDALLLPAYDSSRGTGLNLGKPGLELNMKIATPPPMPKETFNWKPALWQSFKFLLLEHAFRMADDPFARHLVWHKRFWDDYLQSANHFNMSRWGDGDDFLTNYIGHPMEGAVSGLIQIQNDPKGRDAHFGKSSRYWESRMKAMAWAAVYSAYFEIGPVLSETALGNEGGYTYVEHCGHAPCSKPGVKLKPPTNNTGWVDFVITPVVGMGWIVLEDAIEREVVDRLAGDDPRLRWKILRGALTPSHVMANTLAGKVPWYRWHPPDENSLLAHKGTPGENQHPNEAIDNWEIGIGYTSLNAPVDWQGCTSCRTTSSGLALTFDRRLTRWIAFDSEVDLLPGSGAQGEKGSMTEGLFGARIGHPFHSWGIFTNVRAGFIYYDKALANGTLNKYTSMTRFAADVGEYFEYYPSEHSTLRFGVSNTMVRYLQPERDPQQPHISVLSDALIDTHSNLQLRSEYVFRF